jgi:membrane fusion protein, multidrug efflux system
MKPASKKLLIPIFLCIIIGAGGGYWAIQSRSGNANAATKTDAKPDDSKSSKKDEKKDAKKDEKSGKDGKKEDEKPKPVELAQADLAFVQSRDLGNQLQISGTIRPVNQATVKSRVSAEVRQAHVKEGERVAKGALLFTLDSTDWNSRMIAQQGAVDEAKARLGLAQKNQGSNQALRDKGFISQNALDTTSNNVDVAQAALKSAQAQLALSKRQLDETAVRAPIAGLIAKRHVQAGEKVTEGQSLLHVVDLAQMELEAQLPLAELGGVKVGSAVQFKVDGFDTREFTGQVERINPAAEAGSRSIMLYIKVPNQDDSLRGGMFAAGKLKAASSGVVQTLPLGALYEEAGSTFVYAVKDKQVQRVPVEVGQRSLDQGVFETKTAIDSKQAIIAVKTAGLKHGQEALLK